MTRAVALTLAAVALAVTLAGCFNVASPDLFLLTRTGSGRTLTLLVNDSGTIACNGGTAKPIANATLIEARDLADDLAPLAAKKLSVPSPPGTVTAFRIRLPQGTIAFPDRAATSRPPLARAELFATQEAQRACGLPG